MEYNYLSENFISTPTGLDNRIIIYDKTGAFTYSVDPTTISHTYIRNNCLIIKIFNKNDISLSFIDTTTAKLSLLKLDTIRKMHYSVWMEGNSTPEIIHIFGDIDQSHSNIFTLSGYTFAILGVLTGSTYFRMDSTDGLNKNVYDMYPLWINSTHLLIEKLSDKSIYGLYTISNGTISTTYLSFNISLIPNQGNGILSNNDYCKLKFY